MFSIDVIITSKQNNVPSAEWNTNILGVLKLVQQKCIQLNSILHDASHPGSRCLTPILMEVSAITLDVLKAYAGPQFIL